MKIVKHDLGNTHQSIEIINGGDLHIGEAEFNESLLDSVIKGIKDNPNRYITLNGDLINNAVRNSVSDIYAEKMSPEEQLDFLCEKFEPIKDKILGITQGNHEFRTYTQTGIDITKLFARTLGIADRYDPNCMVIFVSFGINKHRPDKRHTVSLFLTHMGGTKARLTSMADIVDADIYFRGHYHNVEIKKLSTFKTDIRYKTLTKRTKVFVQNGSLLDYGGYVAMKGYAPGSSVLPMVKVSIKNRRNQEFTDFKVIA